MARDHQPDQTPPPDDADRGLAAEVSAISDEQWLAGHRALIDLGVLPPEETAYLYDPGRDPATVTADELTPGRDPAEPDQGGDRG